MAVMGIVVSIYMLGSNHAEQLAAVLAANSQSAPAESARGFAGRLKAWLSTPTPSPNAGDALVADLHDSAIWVFDAVSSVPVDQSLVIDVDKSWDVIDRSLGALAAKGKIDDAARQMLIRAPALQVQEGGVYPKSAEQVRAIAEALEPLTAKEFLAVRASASKGAYCGDTFEDDIEFLNYFWDYLDDARWFFRCASRQGRPILVVQH
jgi:Domain of unknown function (DUF1877)